jgi:chorismate dehydratase
MPGIFACKNNGLGSKIKVAAVSYLNTKPLLWGIERSAVRKDIDLILDYPANLAQSLQAGTIDLALMPVAAMPGIPGAQMVSDYGIGADGDVASVCLFSQVPLEEIKTVYLDYQSRSSVRLAQLLLEKHWKKEVVYKQATEHYIDYINGANAGVIIGDRALQQRLNFEYIYDLSGAWKGYTGLPFIFAGWIATRPLPQDFLAAFNEANGVGLEHIPEVVAANPFPYYSLELYYTQNIRYRLDSRMREGLELFLNEIATSK